MLTTIFRNTTRGIFIYFPDGKLKKGKEFSFDSFNYCNIDNEIEMPSLMWEIFHTMKTPISAFYVLAKAINEFIPDNSYNWRAILQYFRKEEILEEQYKLYDQHHRGYNLGDYGMQDRAIEVTNNIIRLNLYEQAMPEVDANLAKFGLVV